MKKLKNNKEIKVYLPPNTLNEISTFIKIPDIGRTLILEFRIATNRRYILNGENREETLYINCIYMGQRINEYSEILKTGLFFFLRERT